MVSRIYWILAAALFALAILLFAIGGTDPGGITDYRAWLLLASGIVVAVLGNVARTIGHDR